MNIPEFVEGDIWWYRIGSRRDPHDPRVWVRREVRAEIIRITRNRIVIRLVDYPDTRTRNVLAGRLYP